MKLPVFDIDTGAGQVRVRMNGIDLGVRGVEFKQELGKTPIVVITFAARSVNGGPVTDS